MKTYLLYPTEAQEKIIQTFLETNNIDFFIDSDDETLPNHVLEGIKKGQEDIKAGRFFTYKEFNKRVESNE